ncbi:DUF6247 family protein [Streptomyces sp. NPDC048337]|uniref:DUF6247 family protein n=1 Tax=Streptomyces sp. NPDC048337 TaxID=3365535 RepID=UPI003723D90F
MTAQHADQPARPNTTYPLRTIGDIRAALRQGQGFPNDRADFEADLTRALEASSDLDLGAVADVIRDYRGRILLHSDPAFEAALAEGIDLTQQMKAEGSR